MVRRWVSKRDFYVYRHIALCVHWPGGTLGQPGSLAAGGLLLRYPPRADLRACSRAQPDFTLLRRVGGWLCSSGCSRHGAKPLVGFRRFAKRC